MALDAKEWDFIICDAHLPDFDWSAALAIYKQKGLDIPFIMVSGTQDEDLAVERIKSGVHEHVLKDSLARLPAAVKRELCAVQERRLRKHANADYIVSLTEPTDDAFIGTTLEGTIVNWNG